METLPKSEVGARSRKEVGSFFGPFRFASTQHPSLSWAATGRLFLIYTFQMAR